VSFFCIIGDVLMEELWLIIAIAVGIISIAIAIAFLARKKKQAFQDDTLLTLGTTLVVLGIIFGDDRLVGYSFIGVGVLLSIISAVRRLRKK
jgi:asparagine N-glycosylation enzyme membrane subunit Stt3